MRASLICLLLVGFVAVGFQGQPAAADDVVDVKEAEVGQKGEEFENKELDTNNVVDEGEEEEEQHIASQSVDEGHGNDHAEEEGEEHQEEEIEDGHVEEEMRDASSKKKAFDLDDDVQEEAGEDDNSEDLEDEE